MKATEQKASFWKTLKWHLLNCFSASAISALTIGILVSLVQTEHDPLGVVLIFTVFGLGIALFEIPTGLLAGFIASIIKRLLNFWDRPFITYLVSFLVAHIFQYLWAFWYFSRDVNPLRQDEAVSNMAFWVSIFAFLTLFQTIIATLIAKLRNRFAKGKDPTDFIIKD